jgi:hypothetical protein
MKMRSRLLLFLIFAFPGSATAQSTDCTSMPSAEDRVDCYNQSVPKAEPPTDAGEPEHKIKFIDQLAIENERLAEKMKTICRGCSTGDEAREKAAEMTRRVVSERSGRARSLTQGAPPPNFPALRRASRSASRSPLRTSTLHPNN